MQTKRGNNNIIKFKKIEAYPQGEANKCGISFGRYDIIEQNKIIVNNLRHHFL